MINMLNIFPYAIYINSTYEYPEYIEVKKFRIFKSDYNFKVIVIDQFGNEIIQLPEMDIEALIDFVENSETDFSLREL